MDDVESELRTALMKLIRDGIESYDPGRIEEIPEFTGLPRIVLEMILDGRDVVRVALWPLMRAAAALGNDIEIGVREGSGRITVSVVGD
jgi:hypothetical protein